MSAAASIRAAFPDAKSLYDILGVAADASASALKRGYYGRA